jgi:transglutaminase superfamily protein
MWEQLQRFRALDSAARGLFLRGALVLPLISLSVRFRGFRATQATLHGFLSFLNGMVRPAQAPISLPAGVSRTAHMVRAAARHGFARPRCLEESLALWWLLGRQGIAATLRIGTRKAGAQLEAHAWVECDGMALNEGDGLHRHYAAFDAAFPALPR